MKHKKGVILSIIGGLLMILGSIVGSLGFIGTALALIAGILGPEMAASINLILIVLGYIAAGGGISVIIGALIAGYGQDRVGRIVMGFGISCSLFGLIIILITNLIGGASINDLFSVFLSTFNGIYGLAGVILSIISRMRLKD